MSVGCGAAHRSQSPAPLPVPLAVLLPCLMCCCGTRCHATHRAACCHAAHCAACCHAANVLLTCCCRAAACSKGHRVGKMWSWNLEAGAEWGEGAKALMLMVSARLPCEHFRVWVVR
jgi:hypothetical protein